MQPPISSNDLYSLHMNKSKKQTELLLLKFKTKKSPDMLRRCKYSERLVFIELRNETTSHQGLEAFLEIRNRGLANINLEHVGSVNGVDG